MCIEEIIFILKTRKDGARNPTSISLVFSSRGTIKTLMIVRPVFLFCNVLHIVINVKKQNVLAPSLTSQIQTATLSIQKRAFK